MKEIQKVTVEIEFEYENHKEAEKIPALTCAVVNNGFTAYKPFKGINLVKVETEKEYFDFNKKDDVIEFINTVVYCDEGSNIEECYGCAFEDSDNCEELKKKEAKKLKKVIGEKFI